jgi:hypothetical protein
MLGEGARPEVVRDILGHVNICVTQNVYGNGWWKERVDAATQAVEAVNNSRGYFGIVENVARRRKYRGL